MKSKLFILMVLFMLVGASSVSAQNPEVLEYMSDSFTLDSAPAWDCSAHYYVYIAHSGDKFGGLINITEQVYEEGVISKVRVLLLNERNYNIFKDNSREENYDVMFQIDVIADNETVFWEAIYGAGEIAYFVYWYMEPASRNVGQVEVYIEMWDCEHYTSTITHPTNTTTTTTDTTTTTTDTTSTTTDEIEDIFLIYLLLGVLGGIGVIVIYMVVRPKKVKYVWENK